MVRPEDLSKEDLIRVTVRDRYTKGEMAARIGALVQENLDLMAIIQELQRDLADVRESEALLFSANSPLNGEAAPDQQQLFVTD